MMSLALQLCACAGCSVSVVPANGHSVAIDVTRTVQDRALRTCDRDCSVSGLSLSKILQLLTSLALSKVQSDLCQDNY